MSLALMLVVASALVLIASGLNQSEPAVVQAVDAAGSGSASPGQNSAYLSIGIILMGAGAVLAAVPAACGGRRVPPDAARYPTARPVPALVR